MNEIWTTVAAYYGLDWIAMAFGLYGTFLLTKNNSNGFLFSAVACVLGLIVAAMSHQAGYIVYNFILMSMTARAFVIRPKRVSI